MKKTLVSALTTALVVGAASTTFAAANPFADVPADHWAYDAVSELQAKGVVNGYAVDNTFRGNQNMTRYEMAQIVAKAMAKVESGDAATKAMVDKLAAEFRDELANLGVRMDDLESRMDNVKHSGFIRYRYVVVQGENPCGSEKRADGLAKTRHVVDVGLFAGLTETMVLGKNAHSDVTSVYYCLFLSGCRNDFCKQLCCFLSC